MYWINQAQLDAALDGLDKAGGIARLSKWRSEPWDDGCGSGAVAITGDGMTNVTVDLDLFVTCPVSGTELAGATVKGTFKLARKGTVAEDGGAS